MTDLLEITKTPISNQQTIILNKSLRWVLSISSYSLFIPLAFIEPSRTKRWESVSTEEGEKKTYIRS